MEDLKEAFQERPEVLIVGTGYSGLMRVPNEVSDYVKTIGIELIVQSTKEACKTFNRLVQSKRVVAALHLTC